MKSIQELIEIGTITLQTRVLGTLPVLRSGEIVTAETHTVFAIDATHGIVECDVEFSGNRVTAGWMKAGADANTWMEYDIGDCYSTRAAAEIDMAIAETGD